MEAVLKASSAAEAMRNRLEREHQQRPGASTRASSVPGELLVSNLMFARSTTKTDPSQQANICAAGNKEGVYRRVIMKIEGESKIDVTFATPALAKAAL